MAIYTVLAPATPEGETDPMAFVFVKEGLSWPALISPELWLIFRRMWLVLLAYVLAAIVLIAVASAVGTSLPFAMLLLTRLLLAIEGNELRRWTLRRRGYRMADVVEGRNLEEAEIRFFAAREDSGSSAPAAVSPPQQPPPPPPPPPLPAKLGPVTPSVEAGDVVGLFPAPQGGGG